MSLAKISLLWSVFGKKYIFILCHFSFKFSPFTVYPTNRYRSVIKLSFHQKKIRSVIRYLDNWSGFPINFERKDHCKSFFQTPSKVLPFSCIAPYLLVQSSQTSALLPQGVALEPWSYLQALERFPWPWQFLSPVDWLISNSKDRQWPG